MKENIPNNISTNQSMTSPNNKKVKKRINSIVIQEVNKVLTSQRLNQLTSYLDYLNKSLSFTCVICDVCISFLEINFHLITSTTFNYST